MMASAHMYLFCLIYCLNNILAFGGYNHGHNRLSFVTDKTIKKILNDDSIELSEVELKENVDGNDKASEFIWDKHFPKPIFYFIECQAFINSDTENKLLMKCFSNKNKEIFKFEIEKKNRKLQETNFYDTNNNGLNFRNEKEIGQEYLVSNRRENISSIRNSRKYMRRIKNIRSSCQVIIGKFNEYLRAIQTLRIETCKISDYDEKFIFKIWEVEKYVVGMLNILFKTLATLSIPSLNKLEFVQPYEHFKKNMEEFYNMIKSLKDTCNEEFSRNNKFLSQNNFDAHAEIILKDLKSVGFNSIDRLYRLFMKKLESLNSLVKDITDNTEVNVSIIIDCNVEKVDKFVEKYSSYLLDYSNILDNCDELFLNEYFFRKNLITGSLDLTPLEHTHEDILIAREMKKYLSNYQNNNTDFLIFSQTDYFKNKLSEIIKLNLRNLIFSTWSKNKFERKIAKNNDIKLSDDDSNYIERIEKLQKDLKSVFNSEDSSTPLTFQKIMDSLECDQVQNNITPSCINSDDQNQNTNNEQSEDENQESTQTSEESHLDEDENQLANKDNTFDKAKIEENPNSLENSISKDEIRQLRSEIANDTNLQTNNKDNQEKGQKSKNDIKVEEEVKHDESKNLKDNDKENNEQNSKDILNQTNNKVNLDKFNESNNKKSDQPGQNEAQNKIIKNELNLDEGQKTIKENKISIDDNLEENNKETTEKQNVKPNFVENYLIYIICGLSIASCILGFSIYYFSSSQ